MAYREETPLAYEPRSGSGVSATLINFGDIQHITMYLKVGNASSLNLRVYLEDSADGVDWYEVESMTVTTSGYFALRSEKPTADNIRIRYHVASGSASFGVTLAAA